MTSLAVNWEEARKAAGLVLGIRRDDPDLWTTQERSDYDIVRRSGLTKFYSAHQWSFLNPLFPISTNKPYTTGTVEIVSWVLGFGGTAEVMEPASPRADVAADARRAAARYGGSRPD